MQVHTVQCYQLAWWTSLPYFERILKKASSTSTGNLITMDLVAMDIWILLTVSIKISIWISSCQLLCRWCCAPEVCIRWFPCLGPPSCCSCCIFLCQASPEPAGELHPRRAAWAQGCWLLTGVTPLLMQDMLEATTAWMWRSAGEMWRHLFPSQQH